MPMDVLFLKEQTVEHLAGQPVMKPIKRGGLIRELRLRLQHQITCTAANNAVANFKRGDGWAAIERLDIVLNGNEVVRSLSGLELVMMHRACYKKWPRFNTNYGDQLTANPAFDSVLKLPFWLPFGARPMDSALNSSLANDMKIVVQWASDQTKINSAASAYTAVPTLEVYSHQSGSPNGNNQNVRTAASKITRNVFQPNAATTSFFADLTPGAMIAGFLINSASAAGVDEATRINSLKIKAGSTVYWEAPRRILQSFNEDLEIYRSGVSGNKLLDSTTGVANDTVVDVGGAFNQATLNADFADIITKVNSLMCNYSSPIRSADFDQDAWYFINTIPDGWLAEALDTYLLGDFGIEMDVTGASNITIIPIEIFPPREERK
jgi:hypothetical protein